MHVYGAIRGRCFWTAPREPASNGSCLPAPGGTSYAAIRFLAADAVGNALKGSLSKYYGKGCTSTIRGDGCDVPVLTQVLDLARPAVCALGPLMTHLEVSVTCRRLYAIKYGSHDFFPWCIRSCFVTIHLCLRTLPVLEVYLFLEFFSHTQKDKVRLTFFLFTSSYIHRRMQDKARVQCV